VEALDISLEEAMTGRVLPLRREKLPRRLEENGNKLKKRQGSSGRNGIEFQEARKLLGPQAMPKLPRPNHDN